MKEWLDFSYKAFNLIKSKRKIEYYNVPAAFDIETTSTYYKERKVAFMYEWTLGINDEIVYGRTWHDFINFLNFLKAHYELNSERRFIIYVHNLSFEFQFMRKLFEWQKVFATELRKAVYAVIDGFEFKDSLILSGKSLKAIGKEVGVDKLVGDLDYEKIRTHKTQLTEQELSYCYNDVDILLKYITKEIKRYGNVSNIPLTNTGRVRRLTKFNCYGAYKKLTGARRRYSELMQECKLTLQTYMQLKRAFTGGFTHCSLQYAGKLLQNVTSMDITSSYPAAMCSEKFPVGRPQEVQPDNVDIYSNKYNYLLTVKFYNIQANGNYESYIAYSKALKIRGAQINNGRVYACEYCALILTEIDLKIILKSYDIESYEIVQAFRFYSNYLPRAIIKTVIDLYNDKNALKGTDNKTEYNNKKSLLNSVYGMCVTSVIQDDYLYTDDWHIKVKTEQEMHEAIEKYNTSKKRFLYYAWGVWVTAYARKNLWQLIMSLKNDYVYSDTDSVKFLNYEKNKKLFDEYNEVIKTKIKRMCDYHKIKINDDKLGTWDYEGTYQYFKSLGAKRYLIYKDKQFYLTVAGLAKQDAMKYITEKCKTVKAVFDFFNDDMRIPAGHTGKLTHTFIDNEIELAITDYTGKTAYVKTLSGVHLEAAEYSLSIAAAYAEFLKMFGQGYIHEGIITY